MESGVRARSISADGSTTPRRPGSRETRERSESWQRCFHDGWGWDPFLSSLYRQCELQLNTREIESPESYVVLLKHFHSLQCWWTLATCISATQSSVPASLELPHPYSSRCIRHMSIIDISGEMGVVVVSGTIVVTTELQQCFPEINAQRGLRKRLRTTRTRVSASLL